MRVQQLFELSCKNIESPSTELKVASEIIKEKLGVSHLQVWVPGRVRIGEGMKNFQWKIGGGVLNFLTSF